MSIGMMINALLELRFPWMMALIMCQKLQYPTVPWYIRTDLTPDGNRVSMACPGVQPFESCVWLQSWQRLLRWSYRQINLSWTLESFKS